jgi:hypothetical protein
LLYCFSYKLLTIIKMHAEKNAGASDESPFPGEHKNSVLHSELNTLPWINKKNSSHNNVQEDAENINGWPKEIATVDSDGLKAQYKYKSSESKHPGTVKYKYLQHCK